MRNPAVSSCAHVFSLAAALFLAALSASGAAEPAALCIPVVVSDSALPMLVGCTPASQGLPAESAGEFRVCLRADTPHTLIVFRNGTQIGELDVAATDLFLAKHPDLRAQFALTPRGAQTVADTKRGSPVPWLLGEESFFGTVFSKNIDGKTKVRKILALGAWRTGITATDGFDIAASYEVVGRNTVRCMAVAPIYFAYAGIGYQGSAFVGPLASKLLSDTGNTYHNHSFAWTIGLPFIRYEMQFGAPVLPWYFWLEEDIVQVMNHGGEGKPLVRAEWRWDKQYGSDIAHWIYLRMGHLCCDLLLDRYVYRQGIVRLSLERMPSIFGTWGVSWTKAADTWIPGVWVEFPQVCSLFSVGAYRVPLIIEPFRIHFDYWRPHRYNIGTAVSVQVGCTKSGPARSSQSPQEKQEMVRMTFVKERL
jgi:hypothetical protein